MENGEILVKINWNDPDYRNYFQGVDRRCKIAVICTNSFLDEWKMREANITIEGITMIML